MRSVLLVVRGRTGPTGANAPSPDLMHSRKRWGLLIRYFFLRRWPRRRLVRRLADGGIGGLRRWANVGATSLVAGALVIMALSRFVPLSAVQFYVQGLACYAAMLPLAYAMWRPSASAQVPRVVPQPTTTGPGVG